MVLKPSEQTPLTSLRLAELAADIFPEGVFNVVTGHGEPVGDAPRAASRSRMVSLTGDVGDRQGDREGRGRRRSSRSTSSSAARLRS